MSELQSFDFGAHESDNFLEARAVIQRHMEAVTAGLQAIEARMQASGELGRLAALGANSADAKDGSLGELRQDRPDLLGSYAESVELKEEFSMMPCPYPLSETDELFRKNHLYLWSIYKTISTFGLFIKPSLPLVYL